MGYGCDGPITCPLCGNPKADMQFVSDPEHLWEGCDRCGYHFEETDTWCAVSQHQLTFRVDATPPQVDGLPSLWWDFRDGDGPVKLCEGDAVYQITSLLSRFVTEEYVRRSEYRRDTGVDKPN
jgi:hypothetical protein